MDYYAGLLQGQMGARRVAPNNQLANEAAVKALKFQYFEQEKQNRGW